MVPSEGRRGTTVDTILSTGHTYDTLSITTTPGRDTHRAMFPWQSGSEGKEETQRVHLNPLSGRWEPDLSHNQRHVNAAIFYNIWRYFQATDDVAFLRDHGARDDAGDRALLGLDRPLQPRARSATRSTE